MWKRKEKSVRTKKPLASWAGHLLKASQHICACIAMLCVISLAMLCSVYVEDYGGRIWLNPLEKNMEEVEGGFFRSAFINSIYEVVRFTAIRGQMETNGVFDPDKEIYISDYYNRKYDRSPYYFDDAVFKLGDLIRWQRMGGLQFSNRPYGGFEEASGVYNKTGYEDNIITYTTEGARLNAAEPSGDNRIYSLANNSFLSLTGISLEEMAFTYEEYKILIEQLQSCIADIYSNYLEYKGLSEKYKENNTSVIYYVITDDEYGNVYTNYGAFDQAKNVSAEKIRDFFQDLDYSAAATRDLRLNFTNSFTIDDDYTTTFLDEYSYAFGDNVTIYVGLDFKNGISDNYAVVNNAWENMNTEQAVSILVILAISFGFYILNSIYLILTTGRRQDVLGQDYLELNWIDSIWTELFLGWCILLSCGVYGIACVLLDYIRLRTENYVSNAEILVVIAGTLGISILVSETLLSLSRRFRAGTLLSKSILFRMVKWIILSIFAFIKNNYQNIKSKFQYYYEHSGLWERTWGFLIIKVVFVSIVLILVSYFTDQWREGMAFLTGLVLILATVLVSYIDIRHRKERVMITEKIEGILAGEKEKVDEAKLSLENAALGHAVNEIGEGIYQAVEKSIKDERLKAELLTNVSHDIKTPLTSIINYVDLLKKEEIGSEKAKEYLEVIESKSQKLKNLIQDLIEVSKISTGNVEYEMIPINFHELAQQAAGEYEDQFKEHCLKLVYSNQCKDAVIMADPRHMWRIMENLLSNVYKYALEGTRVYMDVERLEKELCFTMKNISAKELNVDAEELTERFVRGDASRSTEGSGLGLAIAQNLVEGMGGTLKIVVDGDLFKTRITFQVLEANA